MGRFARGRRLIIGPLAILSVLLAGCTTPAPPSDPSPSPTTSASPASALDRYYSQTLDWQPCEGAFECAEVTVPLDYADPEAGDTTFAVIRQTPVERPQGFLVINPGGPGASGIEYAKAVSAVVSPQVAEAYNIVGFDPRGVGRSNPIDCLTDRQLDAWISGNSDPEDPAQQRRLLAKAKAFGAACAEDAPELIRHVGSDAVVRDLDVLRAALGSEKLNFLGFSYGSVLGARYDEQFGGNVGRMVLDGILHPDLTEDEVVEGQARAFEETLRRYVADCQDKPNCPLGAGGVEAGIARIDRFLESLERKPLRTAGGRRLTEASAAGAILYFLYFPYAGDWNRLSQGLRAGLDGDGTLLLSMLDERLERSPNGRYANNGQEAFYAVNCLDRRPTGTPAELPAIAERLSQAAPTFGRYLAWSEAVCMQWPVPPAAAPAEGSGSGSAPILLVANSHDPATPLPWAERLARDMANAHLVVWESDGHTAYTNGSRCVDDAVDGYLLHGTLPEPGLRCT